MAAIGSINGTALSAIGILNGAAKAGLAIMNGAVFAAGVPIDMGYGAVNGAFTNTNDYTYVSQDNPANDTGTIDTYEFWAASAITGMVAGTAYGSGNNYTTRDSASIGNVTAGSKQTFSGLSISVSSGDFAACYFATGTLDRDTGTGNWYKSGNQFGAGTQTYSYLAGSVQCTYATGST